MNGAGWRRLLLLMAVLTGCQREGAVPPRHELLTPATGKEIRQAALGAGAPVVVVNFWATWCGPCREEMPDLLRLQRVYAGRGLRLVLVSGDTDPEVARGYLAGLGVAFPSYIKAGAEPDPRFIDGLEPSWSGLYPSTFVYDGRGRLRASFEGKQTFAVFEEAVKKVLGEHET